MKNAVLIFTHAIFWVFTLAIAMTISGRMNRSMELQSNLSSAVEAAVDGMAVETSPWNGQKMFTGGFIEGAFYDEEELAVAECVERLVTTLDTDSGVQVDVMKADTKKGVLAIRVTEKFKHPNGKDGTVTCERVAIRDHISETPEEQYKIKFYRTKTDMEAEENCYKIYTVRKGDHIVPPVAPVAEGANFKGWKDYNDHVVDFSEPVGQNQTYYATW